ncbi:interferon lambda-2-like [Dipodomys spectabilis]|uniref:interferon lambda-2-like n=1 Tax=Dipodomys spectabilis TaxID=105255 RepID=UPI001C547D2D|nr:interferon lambda-2-like [Dipodomys spectabilis]
MESRQSSWSPTQHWNPRATAVLAQQAAVQQDTLSPSRPASRQPGEPGSSAPEAPLQTDARGTDDMAGRHRLLLMWMMAWALGNAQAAPVTKALGTQPSARDCHLGHLRSLSPQVLQTFKRAKDALEQYPLLKEAKCSSHLFPKAWDLRKLQVWERPEALRAELDLTLRVLGSVADPALGDILDQPLSTLRHIHSQLQACAQTQPSSSPRPHSRRLSHWLHKLQAALKQESPGCLLASVTFNLFRLLTLDLSCVAKGPQCA